MGHVMMNSLIIYSLLDNSLNLFFSEIEASFIPPTYYKVELDSLIGKSVECMWVWYAETFWIGLHHCIIRRDMLVSDISVVKFTDIVSVGTNDVFFVDNEAKYWNRMEVYISDSISNIPPWGML